jgi:hypothetical protein
MSWGIKNVKIYRLKENINHFLDTSKINLSYVYTLR